MGLYVVESTHGTHLEADFSGFNVLAKDRFYALVEASYDTLNNRLTNRWARISGRPMAGLYISESGEGIYIDDDGKTVESAKEVLDSLNVEFDKGEELDWVLEKMGRVF